MKSAVTSPPGVYLALSMLAETTGGNSREQILDLLGIGDIEALRDMAVRVFHGIYQDDGVTAVIPMKSAVTSPPGAWKRSGAVFSTGN